MKKIKEIKVGERFKIAGKILIFEREDNKLSVKVTGEYEQFSEFDRPELGQVEDYFESKGYTRESAKVMWEYYEAADPKWTDKLGHPVKNWKQKALTVWMKNAEKIQDKKDAQKPVMVR